MSRTRNIISENIRARSVFPAEMSEVEQGAEVEALTNATISGEELKKDPIQSRLLEIKLSPEDRANVEAYLENARKKLFALGMEDADKLLPTTDQIVFIDDRINDRDHNGSHITLNGTLMVIILREGQSVKDMRIKQIFFHELSHFISKRFFQKSKEDGENEVRVKQASYDRYFEKLEKDRYVSTSSVFTHSFVRGIYSEPSADLFALYCLDDDSRGLYNTPLVRKMLF